jgi:hypothetical protein
LLHVVILYYTMFFNLGKSNEWSNSNSSENISCSKCLTRTGRSG